MNSKLLFTFSKTSSPVAYCILSIGMGTRNEEAKFNGLAHLMEHMLFKGTSKRSSVELSSTLERVGGDMNAFTTKERIVVYTTTLKEDIKQAISLIFEVAFDSQFPSKELRKEKVVVCDEIITYQDSPSELLYDTFENELFESTPLGYSILGEKSTLDKIKSPILKRYRDQYFVPNNMSLTIAGDFKATELKKMISDELCKYHKSADILQVTAKSPNISEVNIPMTSKPFIHQKYDSELELSKGKYFDKTIDKKLRQAHCILGCSAYSYYNTKKRTALSLITNILGGPALNSRLSLSLREKHALVYHVEANFISYKDTGIFSIYFGCEPDFLERCIALIRKELKILVSKNMSKKELNSAKKQMIGQISIAQDNVEAQSLAKGKSLLLKGKFADPEEIRKNIESITAEDVRQVAQEILRWDRISKMVFV